MVRYGPPHVEKHLGEVMCNNKKQERTVLGETMGLAFLLLRFRCLCFSRLLDDEKVIFKEFAVIILSASHTDMVYPYHGS